MLGFAFKGLFSNGKDIVFPGDKILRILKLLPKNKNFPTGSNVTLEYREVALCSAIYFVLSASQGIVDLLLELRDHTATFSAAFLEHALKWLEFSGTFTKHWHRVFAPQLSRSLSQVRILSFSQVVGRCAPNWPLARAIHYLWTQFVVLQVCYKTLKAVDVSRTLILTSEDLIWKPSRFSASSLFATRKEVMKLGALLESYHLATEPPNLKFDEPIHLSTANTWLRDRFLKIFWNHADKAQESDFLICLGKIAEHYTSFPVSDR